MIEELQEGCGVARGEGMGSGVKVVGNKAAWEMEDKHPLETGYMTHSPHCPEYLAKRIDLKSIQTTYSFLQFHSFPPS